MDALELIGQHGACVGHPTPEIFFPGEGERRTANKARTVCFQCPVRVPCLDFALEHYEVGIWGGTTDYERDRKLRPAMQRAAAS